jgi:ubiquinone/menaquinone biosynthesis C-methylase UbiE
MTSKTEEYASQRQMTFTQKDVTRFYDSLVFPSRVPDSEYSLLASRLVEDGWRVGDFGCGQSLFYSAFQKPTLKPVFLDVSFNALKTIDYGVRIRADISQIPLKNGIFNAVFCIGVLHHLPDMYSALKELGRVITTEGILVIGVYSPSSLGARLKYAYDAIRIDFLRKIVFVGATALLWAKLRRRFKLSWQDARKRIADLLETPIVRYLSPEYYEKMATELGLMTVHRENVSNMMILHFRKTQLSSAAIK